jgi:hypothetical protein
VASSSSIRSRLVAAPSWLTAVRISNSSACNAARMCCCACSAGSVRRLHPASRAAWAQKPVVVSPAWSAAVANSSYSSSVKRRLTRCWRPGNRCGRWWAVAGPWHFAGLGGGAGAHGDGHVRRSVGGVSPAARLAPLVPGRVPVVGQRDGIPREPVRVVGASTGAHEQTRAAEAVEKVGFVAGGVGGGADEPPQLVAGHVVAVLAGGLVQLGGRGRTCRGGLDADRAQLVVGQHRHASLRH